MVHCSGKTLIESLRVRGERVSLSHSIDEAAPTAAAWQSRILASAVAANERGPAGDQSTGAGVRSPLLAMVASSDSQDQPAKSSTTDAIRQGGGAAYTSEEETPGDRALPPVGDEPLGTVEHGQTTKENAAEAATGVRREELMIDEHGSASDLAAGSELRREAASDATEQLHSEAFTLP